MIAWLYNTQLFIATAVGLLALILGLAKRKPSGLSIGALALVQLEASPPKKVVAAHSERLLYFGLVFGVFAVHPW